MTVTWTGTDAYHAVLSTGASPGTNGFAGNQTSAFGLSGPAGISATFGASPSPALAANTTYYVDVYDETQSAYVGFTNSTSTLADAPTAGPPPQATSPYTISASWGPGANPAGTLYDCQISTDPLFSVLSGDSRAANVQIAFPGPLTPNTAYYLRVEALDNNGIPSAGGFVSLSGSGPTDTPPASLVQGFTSVGTTLATVVWGDGGNPAGTYYRTVVSSSTPPINWSSESNYVQTTNLYASYSGLLLNTSYYSAVAVVPTGGGALSFTALGSTITLANPPLAAGTNAFPSLSSGPIIVANWLSNGNPAPPGTAYNLQISPSPTFSPLLPSIGLVESNSSLISGLSSLTTYYLQVQAVNGSGIATSFVSLPSVETPSNQPGLGSPPVVTTSTFLASWTSNGTAAPNTYMAVLSIGAFPNAFAGNQSSATANLSALFSSGLFPNTTYYVEVSSAAGGVETQLAPTATLAAVPTAGTATAASFSITANWAAPSDPPGTLYQLQASTNPAFNPSLGVVFSSITATTTGTVSGLTLLTSYYLQVQAINYAGIGTAFVPFSGYTVTLPSLAPNGPSLSSATLGTSSVTWSWAAVPLASGYNVVDSSTGANLSGSLPLSALSWIDTGLSTNTSYTRSLVAFNGVGASTSAPLSAVTLAAPPASPAIAVVGFTSVTFSWSTGTNPSPRTLYTAEVWNSTSSAAPAVTTTTLVSTGAAVSFTSLVPGSTYFFDVYALNLANVETTHTVSTSTFLPLVVFDSATIYPSAGGALVLYTANGSITALFPPGTFPVPVTASLYWPASDPSNPYLGYPNSLPNARSSIPLSETGVGAELSVVPPLQPNGPISITVGYPAAALAVAGLNSGQLKIAYYDPLENLFVPVASFPNPSLRQVTGQSSRLSTSSRSFFEIAAAAPAADFSAATIYPNPFRPSLGHTVINFAQLPANAQVKIYTVSGELVKEFSADASGTAQWDATNGGGRNAASGGYFALVQGGGNKSVMKIVIQR